MTLPVIATTKNVDLFNSGLKTDVEVVSLDSSYTSDVTPIMTANTTGNYMVSASASGGSNPAYLAFDGNVTTLWSTGTVMSTLITAWIKFDFSVNDKKAIAKYAITPRNDANALTDSPKSWTFEGSNDDSQWVVLDTQTNVTDWVASLVKQFTFTNSTVYRYYRFNITEIVDATRPMVIGEIEMMETIPQHLQLQLRTTRNETGGDANVDITPNMTSNTTPAPYSAFASGEYNATTNPAWKAFDGIVDKTTYTTTGWMANAYSGWVGFDFATPKKIGKVTLVQLGYDSAIYRAKNFKVEYSDDKTTWQEIYVGVLQQNYDKQEFRFNVLEAHRYWRLNIFDNYTGNTSYYSGIAEIEMMEYYNIDYYSSSGSYETPVIDLGRGFKQITKINIDPSFSSVRKISPIMTSNTAPSPYVVDSSSVDSATYSAFKAFDGITDVNNAWLSANGFLAGYVTLDFGTANRKAVGSYTIQSRNADNGFRGDLKNWRLLGSDDKVNWTTLHSKVNEPLWGKAEKRTYQIENKTLYRFYRLYVDLIHSGTNYVSIGEIQYYEAYSMNILTSTSTDGFNFSPYTPLNADGSITSPQAKYIKIKVDFIGGGSVSTTTKNDFVSTESTQFNADTQVVFEGSLKLKTVYVDAMTQDPSIADGKAFSVTIDKTKFKTIEGVMSLEDRNVW